MYLSWGEKKLTDFLEANIENAYNDGYVFTRKGKGSMNQTRSLRIDLSKFELSSENKRILNKVSVSLITTHKLPYQDYSWEIGKMGKDFYSKFGENVFSANKIKELLTDPEKSNFNILLKFESGYAICYQTKNILHYAYPFYTDGGISQMTQAIMWTKESGRNYVYLGSASRPLILTNYSLVG
jgi:hypothetical protein